MLKKGDKVLIDRYSLHKDDYFTVCAYIEDDEFIGRPYFMVSEIANIFYEEEIIFITH